MWQAGFNGSYIKRKKSVPLISDANIIQEIMEPSQQAYCSFQRHVDRLCLLIVASDCSDREIDIERLHLRVQAATLFPEKMGLYDMVYESRFRRLRQQFREHP
jgi:hypothetical protein